MSSPVKIVKVYGEHNKLDRTINKQSVYNACLIDFSKARALSDQFDSEGIEGANGGLRLCDAREIYYDAEQCYTRLLRYFQEHYWKHKRESTRLKLYHILTGNYDVFLVMAFIFTAMLTVDDKEEEEPRTKKKKKEEPEEGTEPVTKKKKKKKEKKKEEQPKQSKVGQRLYEALDDNKNKIPTPQEIRDHFATLSEDKMMAFFDLYQWQINKFPNGSSGVGGDAFHKIYTKRQLEAKEKVRRISPRSTTH